MGVALAIIHGIFMDFPVQKPSSFAHGHGKPHLRPLRIRSTPERRVLDQVLQGWSGAARTQPVAHKGQENPWGKCQEIRDFCIVTKCRSVGRCWEYEKIPIWYGSACIYDYKLSSPPKIWEGPEFGFYLGHHESISMWCSEFPFFTEEMWSSLAGPVLRLKYRAWTGTCRVEAAMCRNGVSNPARKPHTSPPSIYPPIQPAMHPSVYLSTYLPVYLSTYLPIHLSTYLPIYLSTYLSIYLSS